MSYPAKTSPEAIRRAAFTLLDCEGEAGFSVRGVAAVLRIAPNALYHHYAGRDALLAAVADEGARRMLAAVRRGVAALEGPAGNATPDPAARVRACAEAYLRFARLHPAVYSVFMMRHEGLEAAERELAAHDELWMTVVRLVTPFTGAETAPVASVALWGFLHGMVGLERAGLLGGIKPPDAAPFGLETFLAGLRSRGDRVVR
jgi:AcrR family transcriptional regulator